MNTRKKILLIQVLIDFRKKKKKNLGRGMALHKQKGKCVYLKCT